MQVQMSWARSSRMAFDQIHCTESWFLIWMMMKKIQKMRKKKEKEEKEEKEEGKGGLTDIDEKSDDHEGKED